MTGWLIFALIGATAALMLFVLRMPRTQWMLVGAMLMLGAAGYAWQGQPGLAAQPAVDDAEKLPPSPGYKKLRDELFGRFGGESMYFGVSDAALTGGHMDVAVRMLTGGVDYAPDNVALWTELGNVIALHDYSVVSPAALLAYRRAMTVAPRHPGPPFFLGLALVRSGQFAQARPYWARALALTPQDAGYRPEIAQRLVLLDRLLAAMAKQPGGRPAR